MTGDGRDQTTRGSTVTEPTDIGTPADWVAAGERRALREWQQTHPEPCEDCTWAEVQAMCDPEPRLVLDRPCPKHGGNQ